MKDYLLSQDTTAQSKQLEVTSKAFRYSFEWSMPGTVPFTPAHRNKQICYGTDHG